MSNEDSVISESNNLNGVFVAFGYIVLSMYVVWSLPLDLLKKQISYSFPTALDSDLPTLQLHGTWGPGDYKFPLEELRIIEPEAS